MNAETTHFEPGQLQRFLDADLSEADQLAVERHLEVCDECRQQLHRSAADVTWWEDASDFLTDDEFEIVGAGSHTIGPTAIMSQARQSTADGADVNAIPTDVRQIIAWLDPTDDPAMLGRLGGYEIAGVVGAGGMGVVLKGFDRSLNRYVAIKILAPHLATSGAARKRFAREAQAAAAVVHDNVIAIHGVDDSNSLPYLVMPYLRGTSLQRRIDDHGALSVLETLRLGMQTAGGLSAAHDQGLVHRDVKPANILLDGTTERVLLTDFGLARAADDASLTHSGVIAGTPYFMSPEQAEGAAIDHRSDLFSLGSVLYAMCTGRPPFRADTSWGILRKVTDAQPHAIRDLNAEIPVWLCEIIQRLHQKDPANRFQTAHEVADLLGQCLAHVQQPNDFKLPEQLTLNTNPKPSGRMAHLRLLAIGGFTMAGVMAMAVNEWGSTDRSKAPSKPPATSSAGVADVSKSVAATGTSSTPAIDDSLLDWDDGSTRELASIRIAVERLDEVSLQILQTSNAEDDPTTKTMNP
jgi:eukaryotic-like serine/threonine-protein kinase